VEILLSSVVLVTEAVAIFNDPAKYKAPGSVGDKIRSSAGR